MKKLIAVTCLSVISFLVYVAGIALPASAGESFPQKPITWIVPYNPGGGFDTDARAVSRVMEKYLGQPVVIKNVPGAGGRTGVNALYRARPDGYTMGIVNVSGMVVSQTLMKTPFDLNKFTWLGGSSEASYLLAVSGTSPFHTVGDLQKASRKLNAGATGKGSTAYFNLIIVLNALNIPFNLVTGYASSGENVIACLRGDLDLINHDETSLLAHVKSKDLRPILVYRSKRSNFFPETLTVAEIGHPELAALTAPRLIAAPPALPKDRMATLEGALKKALHDPELIAWAKKTDHLIEAMDGQEARKKVQDVTDIFLKYRTILDKYI